MKVRFRGNGQEKWLGELVGRNHTSVEKIAGICGVSGRTVRDWRRGKYLMTSAAVRKICGHFDVSWPKEVKEIDDYWYVFKGARKGGLRRVVLYGIPGNIESRKMGGLESQKRRREDPEKYLSLGCNARKSYVLADKSPELAEIVGVILGDGGITDYQVKIFLDLKSDKRYAIFLRKLMENTLGERPSWYNHKYKNVIVLCLSGVELVERLESLGLGRGNKVRRQVDVPKWVWDDLEYQKACLRGLVDTDGCVYFHRHWTKGIRYRNMGLNFASASLPLLSSASKIMSNLNIKHFVKKENIFVYDFEEVKKYFKLVGSHNPKQKAKFLFHGAHGRKIGVIGGVA